MISVLTFSCADDINTNTSLIRGSANGQLFSARPATATIDADSSVTLIGRSGTRKIILKTASAKEGQYNIGENPANQAFFMAMNDTMYVAKLNIGGGIIEITGNNGKSLSGSFHFKALSGTGDTLNFQKGVFFEVAYGDTLEIGNETELMTAEIGGLPFFATEIVAETKEGTISVAGMNQTTSIILSLPATTAAGTYEFSENGPVSLQYVLQGAIETGLGNLTITTNDTIAKFMKGSFNVTTDISETVIENGSFQFSYQ